MTQIPLFDERDFVPISALQHLLFCERQWALIHLEQNWQDNHLTMEGNLMHARVDTPESEFRGNVKIVRSLRLSSMKFGLSGIADVVEFYRDKYDGWRPYPIEYKRGKPKKDLVDSVQLCAQVLCLEEMLGCYIPKGSFFYGEPKRRFEIDIDEALRKETAKLIIRLHQVAKAQKTPKAKLGKKCQSCSLFDVCMPNCTNGRKSGIAYIERILREIIEDLEELPS